MLHMMQRKTRCQHDVIARRSNSNHHSTGYIAVASPKRHLYHLAQSTVYVKEDSWRVYLILLLDIQGQSVAALRPEDNRRPGMSTTPWPQ